MSIKHVLHYVLNARKYIPFVIIFFFLGFFTNSIFNASQKISPPVKDTGSVASPSATQLIEPQGTLLVTDVIDGDTIEIEGGKRVRYIGINTPETVDPRKPVECFGKEASVENKRLVEGKRVRLEKDVSESDRYGRLLRYVYIDDVLVNDALVLNGFAHASTYPPDVKYQNIFRQSEAQAREKNLGLWAGCPLTFATINPTNTTNPTNEILNDQIKLYNNNNCTIKGNISSTGEKIYHVSGCGSYDKTVIDESFGERWFCTEDEAKAAGWRKAKNC